MGLAFAGVLLGQAVLMGSSTVWTLFPGIFLFAVSAYLLYGQSTAPVPAPPRSVEFIAFILLLIVSLAVHLSALQQQLPPGLFRDFGLTGLSALRVLREGWNPYVVFNPTLVDYPILFSLLAGWFKFFRADVFNLLLFFLLADWIGLAAFFYVFRRLAGPTQGLAAMLLFAFMRWHLILGSTGHPHPMALSLVGLGLALVLAAEGKRWPLALLGGIFLGTAPWIYQGAKAVPFGIAIWLGWEAYRDGGFLKRNHQRFLAAGIGFLLITGPMTVRWIGEGIGVNREGQVALDWAHQTAGSLLAHAGSYLLMFNRLGDATPMESIPGKPTMDMLGGAFFALGLGLWLFSPKRRIAACGLIGLSVGCLPGLLSKDSAHAGRTFEMAPWVALAASEGWMAFWRWARERKVRLRQLAQGGLVLLLLVSAWMNWRQWRYEWAGQPGLWDLFDGAETKLGNDVAQCPVGMEFRVSNQFLHHFTFKYLAYDLLKDCKPLDPSDFLNPPAPGAQRVRFVLDPAQSAYRGVLLTEFPKARVESVNNPKGEPIAYMIDVPSSGFKPLKKTHLGLRARFFIRTPQGDKLFLDRVDRVVNYTNGNDFPRPLGEEGVVVTQWSGWIDAPKTGDYSLRVDASGPFKVKVDGKTQPSPEGIGLIPLYLARGRHAIELNYVPLKEWQEKLNFSLGFAEPGGLTDLTGSSLWFR